MRSVLVAVALVLGCDRGPPAPGPATRVREAAPSSASATPVPAFPRDTAAPCRALRVTGAVHVRSGNSLASLDPLDGERWIELGAGAEVVLKHGRSARELILSGPLVLLPCRDGHEELIVNRGRIRSVAGTGVRPGAEVLIATPFGALRYGDADVELTVDRLSLTVTVRRGDVWVDAARGTRGLPAAGRLRAEQHAKGRGTADANELVRECEALAKEAENGARLVLSGGPSSLGERARAQLVQRRSARSACAVAAAAVDRVDSEATRTRLVDQIGAAERVWRAIPSPNASGPK